MCIPHSTYRDCWYVDHIGSKCEARIMEYRRHFPRIFINEEEDENKVQQEKKDGNMESLVEAATTLRIYESQLDKDEHMARGIKRRRISVEEGSAEKIIVEKRKNKEEDNNTNRERKIITAEELKKAIKEKSHVIDSSNIEEDAKNQQRYPNKTKQVEITKERMQRQRQEDWFRLLGQFTSISRNRSIVIDEEMEQLNQNIVNDWYMIEQQKECIPFEVAEKILTDESELEKGRKRNELVRMSSNADMSNKEVDDLACMGETDPLSWSMIQHEDNSQRATTEEVFIEQENSAQIPMEHLEEAQVDAAVQMKPRQEPVEKLPDGQEEEV